MTPADRRAALVEKVARAIAQDDDWWEDYTLYAERAIVVVLEEAEKVVQGQPRSPSGWRDYWHGYTNALTYAAAALRALREKTS